MAAGHGGHSGRVSALSTLRESLGLLFTRRFGTFWFASLLSSIGTWAQQVAEPWLLLSLGASSFVIGLDSFAMNAPVWALTLVGGVLADRSDRRKVIALFQSIQLLCPTVIVVLLLTHSISTWVVVVLSVVVGVTDALSMPSFASIVPSLVTREQIDRGLALNSTQFNLSRILGPALAGVLMASVGAVACFALSAASYLPFIGVALWILPARVASPGTRGGPSWRHPFVGLKDIVAQPGARAALLTVLITAVFCSQLSTFIPVLVRDAFHADASSFSLTVGAFGLGGLLGALTQMSLPARVDRRTVSAVFAIVFGVALVLVSYSPWFWAVPVLQVVAGAAMTLSNTSANASLQSAASATLLGQTVSLYMLALRGGMSVGSLVTGAVVDLIGVRSALLLDGVAAIALQVALVVWWKRRRSQTPDAV